MAPVLAYWTIRGLAQPIRLLLHYVGEEFEDKHYETGPAPDYNTDSWFNVKYSLGLDFPNLPYYIDGDVKVTQSNAILRYIGRKHKLMGETEAEAVRLDVIENAAMDFRNAAVRLFYNPDFDKLKAQYLIDLKERLELFEKYLQNKKWFVGDKISIVDFPMYEMLDQHKLLDPTCLDAFPKLQEFVERFENLPAIKAYMRSDKFMARPLNNKMAKFGNE
jgi:glutathione S-transferase